MRKSLHDLFFDLFDNLVDPDLDLLLVFFLGLFDLLSSTATIWTHFLLAAQPPGVPLVDESFPLSNELGTDVAFLSSIFLVELSAELLEITTDLTLLFLGEEGGWSWSPQKLLEAVEDVFLDFLTTEVPDSIAVFNLAVNNISYGTQKKVNKE